MHPKGLTLYHPAASLLKEYTKFGCPTQSSKPWTKAEMWELVAQGPHWSTLLSEAIKYFWLKSIAKVVAKQAILVQWDGIKENPPLQVEISPIAAIPHKSKAFFSILDLLFTLHLSDGSKLPSVHDTTIKTAPSEAINQLGHLLSWIIHAFAKADEDDKIFMSKWDVKDGFWQMDCREGEEWNFAYVLLQPTSKPIVLVAPSSLQMGWVESPPFFCAATKMSRAVATQYCKTPVGILPDHKFMKYVTDNDTFHSFDNIEDGTKTCPLNYLLEVFVDNFMAIVIPTTKEKMLHIEKATMQGIHDCFPANDNDDNDPILHNKMKKVESNLSTWKTLLGFEFDGTDKTLWLKKDK
jgi:hypothetical protein